MDEPDVIRSMTLDLNPASEIADEVCGSQRDKTGDPYLFHVFRRAAPVES